MQLTELCLNPKELRSLQSLTKFMPQSLLLTAETGFGKTTISSTLADQLTASRKEHQLNIAALSENNHITIEQARQIKSFFTLKTNGSGVKRVVVIDKSDQMTHEAQNSLLKIIEEPPEDCYLILTSSRPQNILPTILSRVTTHILTAPSTDDLRLYCLSKGYADSDVNATLSIAGSLPGLAISILNKESNTLVDSVSSAKELLAMSTLERLRQIESLSKDRQLTITVLEAMKIVADAAITNLLKSGKSVTKWVNILDLSNKALAQIEQNASTKLVLSNLFLSI